MGSIGRCASWLTSRLEHEGIVHVRLTTFGRELEPHDVRRHAVFDIVITHRAATRGLRGFHGTIATDHEVHDQLAAETGTTVELVLIAGAEHAGARLDDAVDLFGGEATEVALGIRERDLHFFHAGAARRLRAGATARAVFAGIDLSLVRDEVAFGVAAATVAVAFATARRAGAVALADARAGARAEADVTFLELALDAGELRVG